ncbi:hypothetical protein SRABI106_02517 [Rahnella aquatilis]|nr:hypothetical protein SRABI106_02517 [Rahnella aquatilis]
MAELIYCRITIATFIPARIINHIGFHLGTGLTIHSQGTDGIAAKIKTKSNRTLRHSFSLLQVCRSHYGGESNCSNSRRMQKSE